MYTRVQGCSAASLPTAKPRKEATEMIKVQARLKELIFAYSRGENCIRRLRKAGEARKDPLLYSLRNPISTRLGFYNWNALIIAELCWFVN